MENLLVRSGYNYASSSSSNGDAVFAMFFALFFISAMVIGVALYISRSVALYNVAKVENFEYPWFAFIPILSIYLLLKITDQKGELMFLLLACIIPFIGEIIYFGFMIYLLVLEFRVFEKYKVEPVWFIVGIFFFPVLFFAYYKLYQNAKALQYN